MFKLSQAASAANIAAQTLGAWLDRKLIDIPASGTGNHRKFTRDDIVRIGIIAELVRLGIAVGELARAAAVFCDDCDGNRDAASLYPSGRTVLIVDESGPRVINFEATREQFESAMASVYAEARTAIVLNVNEVARRVDAALDGQGKPMPPVGQLFRNGKQLHV